MYGYDAARSHVAADFRHRPPFRPLWRVETGWFVEFPPAIGDGHVFVGNLRGRFLAIQSETGRWCGGNTSAAASPPVLR